MCGVPRNTFFNRVRFIAGSFSQTSMIASEISFVSKAFSSALVSITSPREVLMMTGFCFNDWKKAVSARWWVLYLPSLYKGTWKVSTLHSFASVCRDEKFCFPS